MFKRYAILEDEAGAGDLGLGAGGSDPPAALPGDPPAALPALPLHFSQHRHLGESTRIVRRDDHELREAHRERRHAKDLCAHPLRVRIRKGPNEPGPLFTLGNPLTLPHEVADERKALAAR